MLNEETPIPEVPDKEEVLKLLEKVRLESPDVIVMDSIVPNAPVKVQCKNCDNLLRRTFCEAKNIQVNRNKSIECALFVSRQKREAVKPIYVPHFDKKTKRLVRRLVETGVLPVNEKGEVVFKVDDGTMYRQNQIEMPKTTATAGVIGTTAQGLVPGLETGIETSNPWDQTTTNGQ